MSAHGPSKRRTKLDRTFKPQWIWAIALGSAVGWGAFILPTDWISTAGPLGAAIGLTIGGGLMCLIAVSYGMLIRTYPVSGGEYAYAFTAFGRTNAYICGWFLTLGYAAIVALNASAVALLFRRMVPPVVEWVPLWTIAGWQVYLGEVVVASAAIILFAIMNTHGTALSGRIQFVFCLIMLAAVAFMLIGALAHPDAAFANISPAFPADKSAIPAVLALVAVAPWAFVGFDNVPQAAEEFNFAPRKAFRLIIFAILAAILIYVAMILATSMALDWTDLVASNPAWGTADGMYHLFGVFGMVLLAIGILMGVATGMNGFFVSASRLLFAMGRAHTIPHGFADLNRTKMPAKAIWFVAALCLIAPWFGRQALTWVVDMSSVGVTIAYTYTCLAAFKLFRPTSSPARENDPVGVRSTPKKVLSGFGALAGIGFFLLLMVPGSPAQLGTPSLVALGVWVILGAIFYLTRRSTQSKLSDAEMHYLVMGKEKEEESEEPVVQS